MSTEVAQRPKNDLRSILNGEKMRQQFVAALPRHLSADRFIRVATTALMRTPDLVNCTQESFFKCLLDLSAWGLEPDGRRAHLIPFKNHKKNVTECTLIIDWKGLSELALRSGLIAKLHADVICENDIFRFNLGEIEEHRIDFRNPRGEAYAAYARAVTKDGSTFIAVMTKDEILAVRNGSQGWQSFQKGYAKQSPWDPNNPGSELEMWKKTAFRRLSKWLPLSAEFRDAIDVDDDEHTIRNVTPDGPARLPGGRVTKAPPVTLEDAFSEVPADAEPAPGADPSNDPKREPENSASDEFIPAQAIDDIRSVIDEAEITVATFEAKARAANVLTATQMLGVKLPEAKLRELLGHAREIIDGTYSAGGAQ